MTVKEAIKILETMPENAVLYTADHDHSEWETNGRVGYIEHINQSKMSYKFKYYLDRDPCFKIKGDYVVFRVS